MTLDIIWHNLLLKPVHLEKVAQDHIQAGFGHLERRRLHNLCAWPVPMPGYSWHFFIILCVQELRQSLWSGKSKTSFPLRNNRKLFYSGFPSYVTSCSKWEKALPKPQMLRRELHGFEKSIWEKEQQWDKAWQHFKRIPNKKLKVVDKGIIFQDLTSSIHKETEAQYYIWNTTYFLLLTKKDVKSQILSHDLCEIRVCCI